MNNNTISFEIDENHWFPLWRHKNLQTGEYVHLSDGIASKIVSTIKNEPTEQSHSWEEIELPRWHK